MQKEFCGEFSFIYYEVNGQLFSNVALALPVLVHLVRPCLVEAECVEQKPFEMNHESTASSDRLCGLRNIVVMFNCFHNAFELAQGYPIVQYNSED